MVLLMSPWASRESLGFWSDAVANGIPTETRIDEALLQTGLHHLHIQNGTLTRQIELQIDLSGIAKGFAVDRISQLLSREKGLRIIWWKLAGN